MAGSHGPHTVNAPQIMSHRGDLRSHPENTLAALESALAGGIRHLEFDVQINASGTPVVLHDRNLLRTYAVNRSVFEHSDDQSPSLPVLEDVLDLADRFADSTLYVEIKHDSLEHWGESFVLERLLPWADRLGPHFLFARSTTFLSQVRQAGHLKVGVIVSEWTESNRERLLSLEPDVLVVNFQRVPEGENLWPGPWQWAVYEIDDYPSALRWGERGADFILSHVGVDLHQQREALST